jgi:lipopolysaccharide transport system ATP-binding protein
MAEKDSVLKASSISKKFSRSLKRSLAYALRDVVAEVSGGRAHTDRLRPGEFWAVRDINLTLNKGTALGLVGPNGSGKSTLLRLISGLIKPDTGELRIKGKVAPLIALGAGFSPILSGRENVFVNMAILGLKHREICDQFERVLEFAEIGDAIDAPVQTYSSGMVARLGFACAVHTAPDILLIDEVLSVGDMKFRSKCYRRLAQLKRNGTSFVLVSHNSNAILSMCDTALYISQGEQVCTGLPPDVMNRFERELLSAPGQESITGRLVLPKKQAEDSTGLDILSVYLRNSVGDLIGHAQSGVSARVCVKCEVRHGLGGIGLWLIVRQSNGELEPVLTLNSERDAVSFDLGKGVQELECCLPNFGLKPGVYTAKISVIQGSVYVLDAVESFRFEVRSSQNLTDSAYYQHREWSTRTVSHDSPRLVGNVDDA